MGIDEQERIAAEEIASPAPPIVCAASKCRLPIQMRLNSNQKPEFAGGIKGERCVGTRADDRLESIANGKGGVESDPAEVESE